MAPAPQSTTSFIPEIMKPCQDKWCLHEEKHHYIRETHVYTVDFLIKNKIIIIIEYRMNRSIQTKNNLIIFA